MHMDNVVHDLYGDDKDASFLYLIFYAHAVTGVAGALCYMCWYASVDSCAARHLNVRSKPHLFMLYIISMMVIIISSVLIELFIVVCRKLYTHLQVLRSYAWGLDCRNKISEIAYNLNDDC